MIDIVSKDIRSRMMSGIRNKNTKPEMVVRKFLHAHGLRFRLHDKSLPGKPDLVLKKHHVAIFVHGCFWHRHKDCKLSYMPASRVDFWSKKFAENVNRDQLAYQALTQDGWRIIVVWECATREKTFDKLSSVIDIVKNSDIEFWETKTT